METLAAGSPVLVDWPEGEKEMDVSFEAGERGLRVALEELGVL